MFTNMKNGHLNAYFERSVVTQMQDPATKVCLEFQQLNLIPGWFSLHLLVSDLRQSTQVHK